MSTFVSRSLLAAAALAGLVTLGSSPAQAFWGHHRRPVAAYPAVPVVTGYAPIVVARPVVVASPIVVASPVVTAGYAPAPVTTYYAPSAPVAAPVTTYYAPPVTTYYAPAAPVVAPVTSYYAPAMVAPAINARRVVIRPW